MQQVGIGLLGFGTVGVGVVEGLQRNGDMLAARLGAEPVIRKIADLDITTDRGVSLPEGVLTTDAYAVIDDPSVQVVIELVGGTGVAREFVLRALDQGKPVVTANKALLAKHGKEIFALAAERGTDIYFGASVGGGIPIIRALREGLVANQVDSIVGILNGTCNYIMTRMEREGLPFDQILEEAQAAGYAEADPSLDVDGFDTAHKAAILAALAYGSPVDFDAIHVEGIRSVTGLDVTCAANLGYRIKLLAVIRREAQMIEVRVHPALVPLDEMLANVNDVFNAVMVHSDLADRTLYYGRGAGREPTASTVLGDVADIVRNIASEAHGRVPAIPSTGQEVTMRPMSEVTCRHYLRLSVEDKPGVMAQISTALGDAGIGLASILQQEKHAAPGVPVVILTHEANEGAVSDAVSKIDALDISLAPTVRIRIEE